MSLPVINPHAAGLDVGSEKIHASIAGAEARVFGACTEDLHALRDWLKANGVTTVAMEATGIYWLSGYEVLEAAGLVSRRTQGRVHWINAEMGPTALISGWFSQLRSIWDMRLEKLETALMEDEK